MEVESSQLARWCMAKKKKLSTSEDGKKQLATDEGQIDGLYDDPKGYVTFGIGHLVGKRRSFLIQGAQSDATLKTKLGVKVLGGKKITYLPASLHGKKDLDSIRDKAIDVAKSDYATRLHKKAYDKLT
ncbi:MAG: hypothetical protein KDA85_08785, partial [Planctomycetaceae bacterium]|nr:hypothetical protein [Planctomycetaceae bacterium]